VWICSRARAWKRSRPLPPSAVRGGEARSWRRRPNPLSFASLAAVGRCGGELERETEKGKRKEREKEKKEKYKIKWENRIEIRLLLHLAHGTSQMVILNYMLFFSLLTSTVALANAMTSSLVYREC
jgi:hypothetical protein